MKRQTLALAAVAAVGVFAAGSVCAAEKTWNYNAAYASPVTPGAWDADENWTGGKPSAADDAKFTQGTQFVALPDAPTALNYFFSDTTAIYIIGDQSFSPVTLKAGANTYIYAPFSASSDSGYHGVNLCGDVLLAKSMTMNVGGFKHRADLYATSAATTRFVFSLGGTICAADNFMMIGPRGNAATQGVWQRVTGNDRFLHYVSGAKIGSSATDYANREIGAGVTVSGTGIAAGTFVKRIFPAQGLIELSAPVAWEDGVTEVTLNFAAYTVSATARINVLQRWDFADNGYYFGKYRDEDDYRVEIVNLQSQQLSRPFFFRTPSGLKPATVVLYDTAHYGTQKNGIDKPLTVENAHLEFARPASGMPGLKALGFGATANCTTRLTVTNHLAAVVNIMTNFTGTIVKDGVGQLSLGTVFGSPSAKLTVAEGVLTVGDTGRNPVVVLNTLTVRSGATLTLADDVTLAVGTIVLEAGAFVNGTGSLRILKGSFDATGVTIGPNVRIVFDGVEHVGETPVTAEKIASASSAAGDPAIWLDATATNSFVFWDESARTIKTWNDRRGAGHLYAYSLGQRPEMAPTVVLDGNAQYYGVRIAKSSHEKRNNYTNTQALAWSQIVKGAKALFVVLGADGGDGPLNVLSLRSGSGGSAAVAGDWSGPFGRENKQTSYSYPIVQPRAADNIKNGKMYQDGVLVDPLVDSFDGSRSGAILHLIESYPTGDGIWVDAMGIGVNNNNNSGWSHDGRVRYYEVVVYTNRLTELERATTAQYLSKKWFGRNSACSAYGEDAIINTISGNHFAKTGAGALEFRVSDSATHLTVEEGTAVIRSDSLARGDLPADGIIMHLDASDTSTYTLLESTDEKGYVTQISDARGGAMSLDSKNTTGDKRMAIRFGDLNGLNTLDFGPLVLGVDQGWPGDAAGAWGRFCLNGTYVGDLDGPTAKAVFMVVGNQGGGNSLLGNSGNGCPTRGWERYTYLNTVTEKKTSPILGSKKASESFLGAGSEGQILACDKKRMFRNDGVGIDPYVAPMKEDYQLVSFNHEVYGAQICTLGASYQAREIGGLRYGELIMYNRGLAEFERNWIEAYLNAKWFGKKAVGYETELAGLEVKAGATAVVVGGAPVTVGAISGSGTVKGSIALSAAATIDVAIKDGAVSGVTVTGGVDFSKGGTVVVHGNPKELAAGAYPLVTATAANFGEGAWTLSVETPYRGRVLTLRPTATGLVLDVAKAGTFLIVR